MPTGALIAGGLGAGGSIISSLIGANAAQTASGQQVALGQQALQTQQGIFNQGLNWAQQLYGNVSNAVQPVLASGESAMSSALPQLQSILGGKLTGSALANAIPGLSFATNWGTTAAENAGSAMGLGGNTSAAVANYAQGAAEQGYSGLVNLLQNLYSSGGQVAGNALGTLGSAAGASASTVGNLASGAMNSLGSTLTGIGQSQAAGTLGSANAISSGITGTASSLGNAALLSSLFNKVGGNNATSIYGPTNNPLGNAAGTPT